MDKDILFQLQKFCAYQDRCEWDVEQKMNDISLPEADRTAYILDLTEEKYIDNKRFAESYTRGHFFQKKWGKRKITDGLRNKNLDSLIIEQAINQNISTKEYVSMLKKIFESYSKAKVFKSTFEKKNKLHQYALQKGYESDLIWEILNKTIK